MDIFQQYVTRSKAGGSGWNVACLIGIYIARRWNVLGLIIIQIALKKTENYILGCGSGSVVCKWSSWKVEQNKEME